ncbi:MAG: FMN-binding negative transcriptional regulator [Sphingobacteriales bacterium]|nr:MAG: FMN-binding negative transcriptional regulator [Sphingobacteriales bacterium]
MPKAFKQEDIDEAIKFIETYPFGILISIDEQKPIATHLPFVVLRNGAHITLYTHLSKANTQHSTFTQDKVLTIFSEPHTYISPTLYEHQQNVPTWNYIAVHIYGKVTIANTNEEKLEILQQQIKTYEPSFKQQFEQLDSTYTQGLLDGIVALKIEVDELQCKEKLSQNKSQRDRASIQQKLADSNDKNLQYLAKKMK